MIEGLECTKYMEYQPFCKRYSIELGLVDSKLTNKSTGPIIHSIYSPHLPNLFYTHALWTLKTLSSQQRIAEMTKIAIENAKFLPATKFIPSVNHMGLKYTLYSLTFFMNLSVHVSSSDKVRDYTAFA